MAKRIITKIGDVFSVRVDGNCKYYFQYIANDMSQLNSSVIRIFCKKYPIDYEPVIDDIIKDKVLFYSHTVLSVGIRLGYWEKVGKHNDIGHPEDAFFRLFEELDFRDLPESHHWYVWRINEPYKFIGDLTEEYKTAEIGMVFSCIEIVHKIKYGDYKTQYPE